MFEQARQHLFTVRDLLRFAVSRFNEARLVYGHGTHNAYDEAAYLVLHSLHLPLDTLEPFLDARLTPRELDRLLRVVEERVNRRLPAAYITHEAWLGEFRFYVDQRVIVPRSFIAELLGGQLAPWVADPAAVESVLDLCTGSGCLAILSAHAFPAAVVDAADLSADALEVACRNVEDYGLEQRVRPVRSDLFGALEGRRYDLIVCNPPYVNAAAMAALPPEYRHEPQLALASGEDGLDAVRAIIAGAAAHLTEDGLLVMEIGHNRDALEGDFPHLGFTWLDTEAGDEYVFLLSRDQLAGG